MRFFRLYIVLWFILLLLPILSCSPAEAVDASGCVSPESSDPSLISLAGAMRYYEDQSSERSFQDILDDRSVAWKPLPQIIPSFGFSNSAFWLKFDLCASRIKQEKPVLEIAYPLLDSIHVFGVADQSLVYEEHSGDNLPFSQRPIQHRNFVFFLPALEEKNINIYIRVQTKSAVQIPLRVYTPTGFFSQNQRALLAQGGYFGIILAMVLYNAFLFFSLREIPYLLYVLFTISYFSFQGVLQGLFQQFIFDSVWLQGHALLIFGFLSILFANFFAVSFLNLPARNILLANILRGIGCLSTLAAVLSSVFPYEIMVKMMLIFAIPSSLLIMSAGFKLWWIGHLPARIFAIAWSTLLVSFVLASFNKFGLLPRLFWTENIMQIGGVLEVILLSIALAERVNEEKRQRILVEQRLASSLEEEVQKRTRELNQALAQLEAANSILDEISHTDSLTQIGNRRSFDIQLAITFKGATRESSPLALVMLDIDRFKHFNDRHGHQAGDKVLQEVSMVINAQATRPGDSVFRYGGEEFAVLLSNTNLVGAQIVAERMRKAVEETPVPIDGESFFVTICAGISVYDPIAPALQTSSPEDIIRQADMQLYKAKENGRNRVEPSAEYFCDHRSVLGVSSK